MQHRTEQNSRSTSIYVMFRIPKILGRNSGFTKVRVSISLKARVPRGVVVLSPQAKEELKPVLVCVCGMDKRYKSRSKLHCTWNIETRAICPSSRVIAFNYEKFHIQLLVDVSYLTTTLGYYCIPVKLD